MSRRRGDAALFDYTRRFDGIDLDEARGAAVAAREIADGATASHRPKPWRRCASRPNGSRAFIAVNCRQPIDYVDALGVRLAARWRPIDAVGLYVPGGTAAYPVLGADERDPGQGRRRRPVGDDGAGTRRAAQPAGARGGRTCSGIDEIYRVGGAQAVAALAYGTATIAAVDKIVGPGNAYVAAAKRRVFGRVGIDMIAGPSEILVVADRATTPIGSPPILLSQAEHDIAAQAILVTDDASLRGGGRGCDRAHLARLPRAEIARASWQAHGAVLDRRRLGRGSRPDRPDRPRASRAGARRGRDVG